MNDLVLAGKAAEWNFLKQLVLDSVSSPITRRVYNMALNEFLDWFRLAPRPGFSKATVSAWRASLESRGLGSSSIIIRMSAIRKLAAQATVLLVEQNFRMASQLADRYVIIDDGRTVAAGTMPDLIADPALIQRYLGAA